MRAFPISLGFFLAAVTLSLFPLIPVIGIFLMIAFMVFLSPLLINAGMLGVAAEALTGRVSRWWLVLPAAFYGVYFAYATADISPMPPRIIWPSVSSARATTQRTQKSRCRSIPNAKASSLRARRSAAGSSELSASSRLFA